MTNKFNLSKRIRETLTDDGNREYIDVKDIKEFIQILIKTGTERIWSNPPKNPHDWELDLTKADFDELVGDELI